jgi:thiol-disulfide isomerase/thioredoxin
MTTPSDLKPSVRRKALPIAAGLVVVAAVGLAAVYGIAGFGRNATPAECKQTADIAKRIAPLVTGEVAAVTPASTPRLLPDLAFHDADGKSRKLSEWRGKTVLLNLWATWCVPCRKEMPALDALEAKLGSGGFQVVAINIDTRSTEKPKTWLKETGATRLAYFADPSAKVFQELKAVGKAFGMPTTLLVDPHGCEIASLAGPAEWASPDAVKLVEAAIGR